MLAPEVLKKLRRIELRTRKIINSTFVGEYKSTFKGTGMEFVDVREYLPGDDVRSTIRAEGDLAFPAAADNAVAAGSEIDDVQAAAPG